MVEEIGGATANVFVGYASVAQSDGLDEKKYDPSQEDEQLATSERRDGWEEFELFGETEKAMDPELTHDDELKGNIKPAKKERKRKTELEKNALHLKLKAKTTPRKEPTEKPGAIPLISWAEELDEVSNLAVMWEDKTSCFDLINAQRMNNTTGINIGQIHIQAYALKVYFSCA